LLQGRICAELRESYRILYSGTEINARVAGRLRHEARSRLDYPAVGDDVLFEERHGEAVVHGIVPRRSAIIRKAAGTAYEGQIIAVNVDYLLIVCALDADFNVRRIERYASLAACSGVAPVLVLNKADLCRDLDLKLLELEHITFPIYVLAAAYGNGIETLQPYLKDTVALVGSSGAGKSTIANALLGEGRQHTAAVRADDSRGRHTTTSRQLFPLASGGSLIDTPGMRELYLWADADAIDDAFGDIETLARQCRFSDCAHDSEPGCAVRAALGDTFDVARFENYCKLRREQAYLERKVDAQAAAQELARWKALHRNAREHVRFKRRQ